MTIEIMWNLYKPSGKWAYGGIVSISGKYRYWDEELLQEIDDLQREIQKGIIVNRSYTLVINETPAQMDKPDYTDFYHALFNARP
jgi:hypothetical protein